MKRLLIIVVVIMGLFYLNNSVELDINGPTSIRNGTNYTLNCTYKMERNQSLLNLTFTTDDKLFYKLYYLNNKLGKNVKILINFPTILKTNIRRSLSTDPENILIV